MRRAVAKPGIELRSPGFPDSLRLGVIQFQNSLLGHHSSLLWALRCVSALISEKLLRHQESGYLIFVVLPGHKGGGRGMWVRPASWASHAPPRKPVSLAPCQKGWAAPSINGSSSLGIHHVPRTMGSSPCAILAVGIMSTPHFTDKKTEAQSGQVTWRRSHSQRAEEPGL